MRYVVLDTETTGMPVTDGHRIIEIGCVELESRRPTGRVFQQYINPDRSIDAGAIEVHGITNEFLADKPKFADIVDELTDFLRGAELIIHNAPFDIGFLEEVLKDAEAIKPYVDRRPAYQTLYTRAIGLYQSITKKALDNEQAGKRPGAAG